MSADGAPTVNAAADSGPTIRPLCVRVHPATPRARALSTSTSVYAISPLRLVQHVVDVEAGLRHRGRDLAQHVRHVRVGDRDAVRRLRAPSRRPGNSPRSRCCRARENRAAGRRPSPRSSPRLRASRRPDAAARSRRGWPCRCGAGKVAHVVAAAASPSSAASTAASSTMPVAREIEQHRAVLHEREALGVDEVARRFEQRHVQRDEIRALSTSSTLCAFCTCEGRLHAASTVICGS